jgi:hypothetical protein
MTTSKDSQKILDDFCMRSTPKSEAGIQRGDIAAPMTLRWTIIR